MVLDSRSNDTALALHRAGLSFMDATTEKAYRGWRSNQNISVIRLAVGSSIPTWLLTPWLGYLWEPSIDWFQIWLPGYLFVIPALAVVVALSCSPWRRLSTVAGALALAVAGSTMVWIIALRVQEIGGARLAGFESTGPTTANIILMASFALFMRLPPVLALMAITPFIGAGTALVSSRLTHDQLEPVFGYAYVVTMCFTAFFVVVISIVVERFMRRAFVNSELLDRGSQALARSRDLIRRYVPQALADHIIDGDLDGTEQPQRRRVTTLFSDIVGFTDLADRIDPEVLTAIVGDYMATMSLIVGESRGTVNEFVGDGLMAIFGAPAPMPPEQQALLAVRAALLMQERLPQLNAKWRKLGLDADVQARIGINTGVSSVGSYGSDGRMTYTAIGLQTNIAARLQSHCTPGEVLLSGATWELVRETIPCVPIGPLHLKGVHFLVSAYSPSKASGHPDTSSAQRSELFMAPECNTEVRYIDSKKA